MKTGKHFYWTLILLFLALLYPARVLARAFLATSPKVEPLNRQVVGSQDIPTNQIILKYHDPQSLNNLTGPVQASQMQRLSQAAGVPLTYVRPMSGEAQVLRLAERLPTEEVQVIARRLMALPEVEYAEADAVLQHTLTPNDPQFTNQWHYFALSAGIYGINAEAAWDITTGAVGVVAAVIDTGITNHADLSGRTVPGYDFIADVPTANDGDGRDSDPSDPGDWITVEESSSGYFAGCPVTNSSWHGTHTAGTIGAASNNGLGVAGVNWNSKILPVRVLGKCGGYTSDIADGMRWAAGLAVTGAPNNPNPANVINVSLGGSGSCSITFQSAISAITAAGTTVVASAGNSNSNASNFTPANCSGVITVAATDRNGLRAYYSNYGTTVEISAPGGAQSFANDPNGVLSTLNTGTQGPAADTYIYYQGTSMAAPHVSGVVSLLYSLNPGFTPAQILQTLQGNVTNFPPGSTCNTTICGSGIVNAGLAVAAAAGGPTPTFTHTATQTRTATATSTPTWTGTPTITHTATSTATSTATPTPTYTTTATATSTPTGTPTSTSTATATSSQTQTASPTSTPTVAHTGTATATSTPTGTGTATSTPTATRTQTATATLTRTATLTNTPTPSKTATASSTATRTSTSTHTATPTATIPVSAPYEIYLPLIRQ